MPQVIPRGKDAVLTKELPEAGKMIFKGWAMDPGVPKAAYKPGDTTNLAAYVLLLVISFASVCGLTVLRRRKRF